MLQPRGIKEEDEEVDEVLLLQILEEAFDEMGLLRTELWTAEELGRNMQML